MAQLDITLGSFRFRMTYSGTLQPEHVDLTMRAFAELTAGIVLDKVRFDDVGGGAYDYKIWTQDGRQWVQVLTFTGPDDPDPIMTFDVNPGWRLTEFSAQRGWRSLCIRMRNSVQASQLRVDPA